MHSVLFSVRCLQMTYIEIKCEHKEISLQRERNAHRWTERPNWIQFEHRGHLRQLLKGLRPVDPKANNRWQNCLKPSFDIIFQCDSVVPWRVYIMCWHHVFFEVNYKLSFRGTIFSETVLILSSWGTATCLCSYPSFYRTHIRTKRTIPRPNAPV